MFHQNDLLRSAREIDAQIKSDPTKKVVLPHRTGQENLFDETEDPFGGNENNRRSAESALKSAEQVAEDNAKAIPKVVVDGVVFEIPGLHTPIVAVPRKSLEEKNRLAKIAADIDKSKAITPPTDPAKAQDYETFQPGTAPVWKPNA